MTDGERAFFHNQLIEANRALITLGMIDLRERNPLAYPAVRDCMQVYSQLLHCQVSMPLSADESGVLQPVVDRLRAYLKMFGEDV